MTIGCGAGHNNLHIKPVLLNTTNAASAKIVTCLTSESLLKFWKVHNISYTIKSYNFYLLEGQNICAKAHFMATTDMV